MAYTVAQLQKVSGNSSGTYMTNVTVNEVTIKTANPFYPDRQDLDFDDFALEVNDGVFEKDQVYYLRVKIFRVPAGYYSQREKGSDTSNIANSDTLKFSLELRDSLTDRQATVSLNQSFQVNRLEKIDLNKQNSWYTYITVFKPNVSCQYLVFKLQRVAYDALYFPGRKWLSDKATSYIQQNKDTETEIEVISIPQNKISWTGTDGDVAKLKDICPYKPLLKMGFQSRPGTLIVVNKSLIRIGRSGIYQINNGTKIYSLMITAPEGASDVKVDAFLLDYAYDKKGN